MVVGLFFAACTPARGASLSWDPNGAAAGTGGIGAWDTTNPVFNGGATTWSNATNAADTAVFAGTAGTVTVSGAITAGGLQFDTTGYLITGSTLTFGTTFTITTSAGTATVGSILAGSNTLTTAGSGTLVLSNSSNSFTGGINVTAGVLSFTADGNLGNGANDPTITNNAVLRYAGTSTTLLGTGRVITFGSGGGTIDVSDANGSLNMQTALVGNTLFDKTGAGTIVLSTASLRTGNTQIDGGVVHIDNATAMGTTATTITVNAGTLEIGTGITLATALTLNNGAMLRGASGATPAYSFASNPIIASGATVSLGTVSGNNTLTIASGFANAGGSTVTPTITIANVTSGGKVVLNSGNAALRANWNVTGGSLFLTNANALGIGNTSGSLGPSTLTINGGFLTINSASALTFNGGTAGAEVGLTVSSASTQITNMRPSPGAAVTHTFGPLSIGGSAISFLSDSSNTSGTTGLTFGTVNLTGNPIFDINTGAQMTFGALNDAGTARTITKSNVGLLVLSATPVSLVGGTVIKVNGGTLKLGVSNALGLNTPTIDFSSNSGSVTFDLNGTNFTPGSLILGGGTATITTGMGTLTLASDVNYAGGSVNTIAGKLAIGSVARTFNIGSGGGVAISADISHGSGGSLLKTGAGTLQLTGAISSFTGGYAINQGTLAALTSSSLGSSTNVLTFGSGGTLELRYDAANTFTQPIVMSSGGTINVNRVTSGAGVTQTLGTLALGGGTLSVASPSGFVSSGTEGLTFGATTLSGSQTFSVTNPSAGSMLLTLGPVDDGGVARTIAKTGTGTLTFGTTPTSLVSGTQFTVNQGALQVGLTGSLGTNLPVVLVSPNTAAGTATLALTGTANQTIGNLTLAGISGTTVSVTTASGVLTLGGNVTLDAANNPNGATISGNLDFGTSAKTFTVGDSTAAANDLTVSSILAAGAGGSLVKSGLGTLVLSGGSTTYAGGISLNQGPLVATTSTGSLGSASAVVTFGGGSLELRNDTALAFTAGLNLQSSSGTIALSRATSGAGVTHTVGPLTIGSRQLTLTTAGSVTSGTEGLTLGGLTLTGSPTFNVVAGATAATTLTLGAINDGGTAATISKTGSGTLALSVASTLASGTSINVKSGTLQLAANNVLGTNNPTLNINPTSGASTVSMSAGVSQFINNLVLGGSAGTISSVVTGTGTLTMNGNLLYDVTSNPAPATISGLFALNSSQPNFNINGGAAVGVPDVTVTAAISGGGASVVKNGAGNLQFGSNSYTGSTTVNAGTLTITADNSLGAAPGSYSANWLNLNAGSTLAATNTFALNVNRGITIGGGAATIDVASGKTLSYAYLGNANGGITGSGTIIKNGAGTLQLSSDNHTYTGAVVVNTGRLAMVAVTGPGGLGSLSDNFNNSSSFTVNGAGELYFDFTQTNLPFVLGGTPTLTHNGGAFTMIGYPTPPPSGGNSVLDSAKTTTFASGFTTITLDAMAGGATIFDYGSFASDIFRSTSSGATVLVRGDSLGATANFNVSQYRAALNGSPALSSSGSGAGTGIMPYMITDAVAGLGSDFVTYIAPSGGPAGFTALAAGQYSSSPASGVNVKITNTSVTVNNLSPQSLLLANTTVSDTVTINSGQTLTLTSGAILSTGTNSNAIGGGILTFGNNSITGYEGIFHVVKDLAVSSNINNNGANAVSLTKSSAGTLTLSGTGSTYSGGTTINAGTVSVSLDANLGNTSGGVKFAGGTLAITSSLSTGRTFTLVGNGYSNAINVANATTLTENGNLTGAGGFTKGGLGTLILNGSDNYTGATTVGAGTLQAGGTTAFGSGSAVSVASGATLALNASSLAIGSLAGAGSVALGSGTLTTGGDGTSTTFLGAIASTGGGLTKQGAGVFTLSGNNTYTGATLISDGALQAGSTTAFSTTSPLTVNSGAALSLNGANNTVGSLAGAGVVSLGSAMLTVADIGSTTFSGAIIGAGTLTKAGATSVNSLTLSGANSYLGGTNFNAGTISVANDSSLGDTFGGLNFNGGTLATTASFSTNRPVSFAASGGFNIAGGSTLTAAGLFSGAGGPTLTTGIGTLLLTSLNSYTGATTVNAGTLKAGSAIAFGSVSAVTVNSPGIVDLNNFSMTIGSLAGSGSVTLNGGTLTTGNANPTTFSGAISGAGAVIKQGSGTFTFGGPNTYNGPTTINAGTLALFGSANPLPTTTVLTVASVSGAVFNLNGVNQTIASLSGGGSGGNVTLGSGVLTVGDATSTTFAGVISGTNGGLTKQGAGNLTLTGFNSYSGPTAINVGTLTAGPSGQPFGSGSAATIAGGATLAIPDNIGGLVALGSLSGTGAVTVGVGDTLTVGTSNNLSSSFSGAISGPGGMTKAGTGAFTLNTTNTYAGTTAVNAGVLRIGVASALGSGPVTLFSGSLDFASDTPLSFTQPITLTGGAQLSSGRATAGAGVTHNVSALTIPSATLTVGAGANVVTDSPFGISIASATLTGFPTFTVNNNGAGSGTLTIGPIGESGGSRTLNKSGAGTLVLSSANSYSEATTIFAGVLKIQNATGLGTVAKGTSVSNGAQLQLDSNLAVGAEALTLNGVGDAAGTGAFRSLGGTSSWAGPITLSTASSIGVDSGTLTAGAAIGGGNSLTKVGAGTLLMGAGATLDSTQTLTIGAGLLDLGGNNQTLANSNALVFGGTSGASPALATGATGTLTINGNVTYNATGNPLAGQLSGNLVNLGGATRTFTIGDSTAAAIDMTVSAALTGGAILKTGAGVLALTNSANSFSGATIHAGTLNVGADANLGSSAGGVTFDSGSTGVLQLDGAFSVASTRLLTLMAGGSVDVTAGHAATIDGKITGAGAFTTTDSGTLTLNNTTNDFSGGTFVTGGTLKLGATNVLPAAGSVTVNGVSATLDLQTFSAAVGVLTLNNGSITGGVGGTLTGSHYTVENGGISAVLGGGGAVLTKNTLATVTLSGVNTYGGGTIVNAGTLSINQDRALGAVPGLATVANLVLNGGALSSSATFTLATNRGIALGPTSGSGSGILDVASGQTLTYGGVIADNGGGTGDLLKTGAGTLLLTGANTYTGLTTINGGTLQIGALGQIVGATQINVAGTLDNSGTVGAIDLEGGTLTGSGTVGAVMLGPGGGAILGNINSSADYVFQSGIVSGALGGTAGLIKTGSGTVTLLGSNSYQGPTSVNFGKLVVNGALTASAVTVGSGATLGGSGSNAGTVTVNSGGHLAPGNSIGTLTTGDLSLSGVYDVELGTTGASHASPGQSDRVNVTGNLTLGGTLNLIDNAGANGNGAFSPGSYRIFTYSAAQSGAFATINNLGSNHAKVDSAVVGSIALDVYRQANASRSPASLNFGAAHVGDTVAAQAISLTNNAANDGFSEKVDATLGAPVGFTTSGAVALLAPGATDSSSLTATLDTSSVGAKAGLVTLTLISNGAGTSGFGATPLASQNVAVNGTVWRLASAGAIAPPGYLGNFHVGATAQTMLVATNTAAADGFSEKLDASLGSAGGDATIAGGPIGLLGPSLTDNSTLLLGISTLSAGAKSGSAQITLASNGAGTSGLASSPLMTQTVNISGTVYRLAAAKAVASPVNLGVVHVGGAFVSQPITIVNTAANDTFSEKLDVGFGALTGNATTAGAIGLLAPGSTDSSSLLVGLGGAAHTSAVGPLTGSAPLTFNSNGGGSSGLGVTALASQSVNITGQVNYLAQPQFTHPSGAGALGGNGASYTLNFGHIAQNSGAYTANLEVLNAQLDPTFQDNLSTAFGNAEVTHFTLTGFNSYSGIAPGATQTGLQITFDSNANHGPFADSLSLHPNSVNASGSTALGDVTLNIIVSQLALAWTGQDGGGGPANSSWDTSNGSTNWADGTIATFHQNGSRVTFGDSNPANGNSSIATSAIAVQTAGVTPVSVTFDNTTTNYSLSNAGAAVGISGSTGIIKNGGGSVTLAGPNTFTGAVVINAGRIRVLDGAALGASAGVSVASGSALELQSGVAIGSIPLVLAGSGVSAGGALNSVSGANSYSGPIAIGAGGATIVSSNPGEILTIGGAIDNGGNLLTVSGGGDTTLGASLSGNGGLTKTGGGTLTLSHANTHSGGAIVNAGTLRTTADGALGNGSLVANAMVSIGGNEPSVTSLSGSATGSLTLATSKTLTVTQAGDTEFAGNLINSGTVAKAGAGTLEISAAPTLDSGSSFAVSQGTLKFNITSGAPSVQPTSTATVSAGASLDLAGSVSALSDVSASAVPSQRVNIASAGVLVIEPPTSGAVIQQVGAIGPLTGVGGSVVLNDGAALTANRIIQNSLTIGVGSTFTLAPSDDMGNSLTAVASTPLHTVSRGAQVLASASISGRPMLADSLIPSNSQMISSESLRSVIPVSSLPMTSLANNDGGERIGVVPEPSGVVLLVVGLLLLGGAASRFRSRLGRSSQSHAKEIATETRRSKRRGTVAT